MAKPRGAKPLFLRPAWFRPQRRICLTRVFGPRVARIAPAHFLADFGIACLPESGEIHRDLHGFAARREHLSEVIEPALQAGKIVISDRFTDASFAYQGGGRGLSLEKLNALEQLVQGRVGGLIQPNITFLFDLPGNVAEERRSKARSPDKFEQLDLSFFEKVRGEYLRRAKADPERFVIIDALKTPDAIWQQLQEISFNY